MADGQSTDRRKDGRLAVAIPRTVQHRAINIIIKKKNILRNKNKQMLVPT